MGNLPVCSTQRQWLLPGSKRLGEKEQLSLSIITYGLRKVSRRQGNLSLRSWLSPAYQPSVIGISLTTAALGPARRLAAAAKRVGTALVVFGGPHEDDSADRSAMWDPCVDISVSGDGEWAFQFLMEAAMLPSNGGSEEIKERLLSAKGPENLEGAANITLGYRPTSPDRHPAWRVIRLANPARPFVNLDTLPFAPRHLLDDQEKFHYSIFEESPGSRKATAQVMTQRGCVAKCDFCSESQRLQKRSAKSVIAELEFLKSSGYRAIFFDDSTFTNLSAPRKAFIAEIGEAARRLDLECGCQTRVDMIDEATLRILSDCGFTYVYFGIESMVPHLLAALGKHYPVETVYSALRMCRDSGLRVGASLLLGAPDPNHHTLETVETAVTTFREIRRFVDEGPINLVSLNAFQYYPGTTSTIRLEKVLSDAADYRTPKSFVFPNEFPYTLLEENPSLCPQGLPEIMDEILTRAFDILGDVIVRDESEDLQKKRQ